MKRIALVILLLISMAIVPTVLGYDRFFYIKDTNSPFEVEKGENVSIGFTLVNKDLVTPKNTEVYIEGCPATWYCGRENYEYNKTGEHKENLTLIVPTTAEEKTYTFYLRLRSDYPTTRGDDRVIVVVGKKMKPTPKPRRNPALEAVKEPVVIEEAQEEPKLEPIPKPETKVKEVVQNIERLEQDKGFKEYTTIVLLVLLIVVGVGGIRAWRKKTV